MGFWRKVKSEESSNAVVPSDFKTEGTLDTLKAEYKAIKDSTRKRWTGFSDGFVSVTELEELEPIYYRPIPGTDTSTSPYGTRLKDQFKEQSFVFKFEKAFDPQNPLGSELPVVKKLGNSSELLDESFTYRLSSYQGTADIRPNPDVFVYTGKEPGDGILPNTLIPLEALRKRICGSPQERRALYYLDWIVSSLNLSHNFVSSSPNLHPSLLSKYPEDFMDLRSDFDGWHFPTWNSIGELFNGSNFLKELFFTPPISLEALPGYMFERWCAVARAAAVEQKEPFSILSRFRNPGVMKDVVFYVQMSPRLGDWLETHDKLVAARNENVCVNQAGKGEMEEEKEGGKLLDSNGNCKAWEDIIDRAFESVRETNMEGNGPEKKTNTIIPASLVCLQHPQNKDLGLVCIGTHPQGLYSIFVCADQRNFLEKSPKKDFPYNFVEAHPKALLGFDTVKEKTIWSTITKKRIIDAKVWPRGTTQKALMGASATDFAKEFWDTDARRTAEWLHKSAYSFGGLNVVNDFGKIVAGSPGTAQTEANIVFGTYEANTHMIRYEDYLKRVAHRHESVAIDLRVELLPDKGVKRYLPWLVPRIHYSWTFEDPYNLNSTVKGNVEFDLFSRYCPTRFEALMDKYVEEAWKEDTKLREFLYCSEMPEVGDMQLSFK